MLGWVTADLPVQVLAVVGLAFLLFLAGLEIDVRALHGRPLALALGGFGITLVVVLAVGVARAGRSIRIGEVLERLQDSTAEIRVRGCVALLLGLVAVASRFGLETILGAFVAGAVLGLVDRDAMTHPRLRAKLDAVGYGFLVPVFFVASGLRLDVRGLLADPSGLARVPVFVLALLAVRGLAALPLLPGVGRRGTAAAGLLQATSLPFILTATQIGVATSAVSPVTAAALVTAGLLSVLLFPAGALALLRGARPAGSVPVDAGAAVAAAPDAPG